MEALTPLDQISALVDAHDAMDALQFKMVEGMACFEPEVKHSFAGGMYIREIFIPKGTLITSYTHKEEHVCVCSQGTITVRGLTGPTRLVCAPETIISKPGARRVGYAHTDTTWTSIHYVGDERDINKIEDMLYVEAKYMRDQGLGILDNEQSGQEEGEAT